jgi:hypothetical protein
MGGAGSENPPQWLNSCAPLALAAPEVPGHPYGESNLPRIVAEATMRASEQAQDLQDDYDHDDRTDDIND